MEGLFRFYQGAMHDTVGSTSLRQHGRGVVVLLKVRGFNDLYFLMLCMLDAWESLKCMPLEFLHCCLFEAQRINTLVTPR